MSLAPCSHKQRHRSHHNERSHSASVYRASYLPPYLSSWSIRDHGSHSAMMINTAVMFGGIIIARVGHVNFDLAQVRFHRCTCITEPHETDRPGQITTTKPRTSSSSKQGDGASKRSSVLLLLEQVCRVHDLLHCRYIQVDGTHHSMRKLLRTDKLSQLPAIEADGQDRTVIVAPLLAHHEHTPIEPDLLFVLFIDVKAQRYIDSMYTK